MDDFQPLKDTQQPTVTPQPPATPPQADDSNVSWDESLLTASFDNQLKLMEKGIRSASKPTTLNKSQDRHQPTTKKDHKFTNKSHLHRFSADGDKSDAVNQQTKVKQLASHVTIMPPPFPSDLSKPETEQEAHASLLMSWYVAGYHAGYYEAIKKFGNK